MTSVPSSSWRCSVESDLQSRRTATDIAAEDWDLLFCAALELLSRIAVERPAPGKPTAQMQALQPPGATLRECLNALDQIRRSAPSGFDR